jgi:HAD superfamily hydrolase (TIGR01548 family)
MDGVLVDVTASYRETIVQTVRSFSGHLMERHTIQDYKNQGGWNNDWALSRKILADLGFDIPYPAVVERFQEIFFGPSGTDGLMRNEAWLDSSDVLNRLAARYRFALFTGRLRGEARITLDRFAKGFEFSPLVGDDDVTEGKPHPEGLYKIRTAHPGAPLWYIGDTVDDARAGKAAGIPFIGIGDARDAGHAGTVALMQAEGAIAVVPSINHLEDVLP